MNYPHSSAKEMKFSFKYLTAPGRTIQLKSIGWETVSSVSYRWNGLRREKGECVLLQISLAGRGAYRIHDTTYPIPPNSGFLCMMPSHSEYFLPEDSAQWEVIYVVMHGSDVLDHCRDIMQKLGPVISFEQHPRPIAIISELYAEIYHQKNRDIDKYAVTAKLYEMIVELHRIADGVGSAGGDMLPDWVAETTDWLRMRYAKPLTLDQIADRSGFSRYYFCRMFHRATGLSPMQYLRKVRVEKAAWLLRRTEMNLDEIALETGLVSGNYLIKVFRACVGVTPNQYRQGKADDIDHQLRIEP